MGFLRCHSQAALMCCEPVPVGCISSHATETITPEKPVKLRVFSFKDLEDATDGFSREMFMGQGSHGSVYKGTLKDGRLVAVKRQEFVKDEMAFDNELEILSTVHSNRFVNLVGFSKDSEEHEKLLVVDFMSNGTLHDILHYCPEPLSWPLRAHLALQIAKSINALHSASPPVIHRDIKSANILIDGRWNAKLGDFGLALRGHIEDVINQPKPPQPAGTLGYIDPAYETPRRLSTKTDVFSFGVLLLELISGREAVDPRYKPLNIIDWALPLIKQGKLYAVFDPKLPVPPQDAKALKNLVAIVVRCLRRSSQKRPSMAYVVAGLEEICIRVPLPQWIGLARVMKRSHMQGPEFPANREICNVWDTSQGSRESEQSNPRLRISYDSQTQRDEEQSNPRLRVSYESQRDDYDAANRDFYRELTVLSNIRENSREYSSTCTKETSIDYSNTSSRDFSQLSKDFSLSNQLQLVSDARDSSFRKIRRDSRESSRDYLRDQPRDSSRDHVREQPRSRPASRGNSREQSRHVSREQSKEWLRADHVDRSLDLARELTRDVVEASLNHIRKWRNCAFDHHLKGDTMISSSSTTKLENTSPEKVLLTQEVESEELTASAASSLVSNETHRRNKSDGSLSFLPEDGPSNLKKRSSSSRGTKPVILKASKDKEQKPGPNIITQWVY